MKTFYITFLILFFGFGIAKAQDTVETQVLLEVEEVVKEPVIIWENSYKEALERAKKEKKPLLIYFTGSDWCGPCKVLGKELFNTEKFQEYADNKIILYKANFPRNKNLVDDETKEVNKELSQRYGQSKFPTMIMVNAKEQELGIKKGMYITEYYYPFFDKAFQSN